MDKSQYGLSLLASYHFHFPFSYYLLRWIISHVYIFIGIPSNSKYQFLLWQFCMEALELTYQVSSPYTDKAIITNASPRWLVTLFSCSFFSTLSNFLFKFFGFYVFFSFSFFLFSFLNIFSPNDLYPCNNYKYHDICFVNSF